jgi:glycosyltransferase involved in cell wall biosynthesis
MRGLYAEERVDGGLWRANSRRYRVVKRLEQAFLRDAAGVVTLTRASVPEVRDRMASAGSRATLAVIPTSVDLRRFEPRPKRTGPFTLAYAGSIGTWYLLDEMMRFGKVVLSLQPDARLLFLVNEGHTRVREAAARAGIGEDRLRVDSVAYDQVPDALGHASAVMALISPAPSKIASAATKVSEALALGLPVAVNRGVGDAAELVSENGVGVVIDPARTESFAERAKELIALAQEPATVERCRAVAQQHFDLDRAVKHYSDLYSALAGRRRP